MKVKLIEKEIGCIEKGLDCVLHHIEKEPDLKRLLSLLKTKMPGRRSKIRLKVGETEDGGIFLQFWKPLRQGWRIYAHYELKPIKEVFREQDGACERTQEKSGKESAEEVSEDGRS